MIYQDNLQILIGDYYIRDSLYFPVGLLHCENGFCGLIFLLNNVIFDRFVLRSDSLSKIHVYANMIRRTEHLWQAGLVGPTGVVTGSLVTSGGEGAVSADERGGSS